MRNGKVLVSSPPCDGKLSLILTHSHPHSFPSSLLPPLPSNKSVRCVKLHQKAFTASSVQRDERGGGEIVQAYGSGATAARAAMKFPRVSAAVAAHGPWVSIELRPDLGSMILSSKTASHLQRMCGESCVLFIACSMNDDTWTGINAIFAGCNHGLITKKHVVHPVLPLSYWPSLLQA
jgi:hypothetical protein